MAELAEGQHGIVTRAQLAGLGLGRRAIEVRIANGRLHRLHRGVYAVGHRVLGDEGRWMAAVLAGGPGAALSHRSAAALWEIHRTASGLIEVTSPRRRRSPPGVRYYQVRLPADEVTVRDEIPVTTVPRTLFDLAGVVPPGRLARAVNEAEVRRLWDPLSLADLLHRHPRRAGAASIRHLVGGGPGITRSELEDLFLAFLDHRGLPRPATNAWLAAGRRRVEVDCAWRKRRLVVELDGHATHGTRAAFERDRARDRALTAAGWRVIRITWRQLRDEPEQLARDLGAALAVKRC